MRLFLELFLLTAEAGQQFLRLLSPMPHFGLLHNLPLDLLRHVLQFLPLLDLASFDQSLNHKYRPCYLAAIDGLELFDINFYLTSDLIHWLISRGVLIKSIPGSTDDANLLELIDYSRNTLKSINLSHSRLSDEIMISSLAICPNLTSINFRACIRLTDHGLQVLLDCRRNIQQLNLSRCCLITRESTKILAEYGSELQDLNLSCLQWLGDEEVKALLEGCPHLQNINLSSTQITINSVIAIIQKYPNLKSLILTGCSRVSSDANKILLRSIYHRQIISEDPSDILLGVIQLNTAFSSGS